MERRARNLFAQKLRMLRLMRGWSQEQLADASGLHRTYISLIERSECNVSLDNLERIADAFELSLPELLGAPDAVFGEKLISGLSSHGKHEEHKRMLFITRRIGEILYIEPDPKTDPATPIGEVFASGRIEVVVVQIRGSQVRLGVAVPLSFKLSMP